MIFFSCSETDRSFNTFSTKCASSPNGGCSERLSQIDAAPSMTATLSDYSAVSSNGHTLLVESSAQLHQDVFKRPWHIQLNRQAGTCLGISVDRRAAIQGLLVTSVSYESGSIIA